MSTSERTIVIGALLAFLFNLILHTYVLAKVLAMSPVDVLVTSVTVSFFPIWVIVIFGLAKRRKWSLQLGLVVSLYFVASSALGLILLAWIELVFTLTVDLVQIGICAYGLRKLDW